MLLEKENNSRNKMAQRWYRPCDDSAILLHANIAIQGVQVQKLGFGCAYILDDMSLHDRFHGSADSTTTFSLWLEFWAFSV